MPAHPSPLNTEERSHSGAAKRANASLLPAKFLSTGFTGAQNGTVYRGRCLELHRTLMAVNSTETEACKLGEFTADRVFTD